MTFVSYDWRKCCRCFQVVTGGWVWRPSITGSTLNHPVPTVLLLHSSGSTCHGPALCVGTINLLTSVSIFKDCFFFKRKGTQSTTHNPTQFSGNLLVNCSSNDSHIPMKYNLYPRIVIIKSV